VRVYLDYNATAPPRPETVEAMTAVLTGPAGNPSSVHRCGQGAATIVANARRALATLIGAAPGEITFTSCGTEAVQTALIGAVGPHRPGRRIVVSAIEHAAGENAAGRLEAAGTRVRRVAPGRDGRVDAEAMLAALDGDTVLVSLMHANNETGVVQPVEAVGRRCRERGILFHVDAAQSVGKMPVDVAALGADLVSLSGHKFGGPQGCGALWVRSGVKVEPLLPGSQEGRRRGGTLNTPALAGLGAAARAAVEALPAEADRTARLREYLEARVAARVPAARLTGASAPRLPNTAHFTFSPAVGGDLVPALDLAGFAVSAGAACTSGSETPSAVLLAMGFLPEEARTALRVSFGPDTTRDQLDAFAAALEAIVAARLGGAAS